MNISSAIKVVLAKGLLVACTASLILPQSSLAKTNAQQSDEQKTDTASNTNAAQTPTEDSKIERVQVVSRKYDGLTNITEDTKKACNYARCRR